MTRTRFLAALRRRLGLPLSETVDVSDSYEALRSDLEQALNRWPGRPTDRQLEVLYTFEDRLIAYVWDAESGGQAWEIPWRRGDGDFEFGDPSEVELVQRYEPVNEGRMRRIVERQQQRLELLPLEESSEAQGNGARPRRVRAVGITADVVNGNGRLYPRHVLEVALMDLRSHLHESAGQGRLIALGEAEHPNDKGTRRPNILETVVKWEAASLDPQGRMLLEGAILPTSKGRDILALVENGVPVGVSMRGYGRSEMVEIDGQRVERVTELRITGFDLVSEPSDPYARLMESQMVQDEEEAEMSEERAMQDQKGQGVDPAEVERLRRELEEARQAQEELERIRREQAVAQAIEEATGELPYGELNELFVEQVWAADPKDPDEVRALVEAKRKEYDAIVAKAKLAQMGRVDVLGPVFERETGQPEYTRPAWEITERLVQRGMARRRDLRDPKTPNERWAARYLEAFDRAFRHKLVEEAQRFQQFMEAETTSDLNLPYSVSRAIVEEAVPELVAASVFDFDLSDSSPTRIYFEEYQEETGASATIVDEAVTASLGGWVSLAHKEIRPGTVVVTDSGGTTTYTEYTDYVVDYSEGRLYTLSGGSITDGQALKVDYTYDAVREGEMTEIQRGKGTLSYQDISLSAMRLATQISDEALTFSRTQVGWDAQARTIAMLIREIREMIDRGIFRLAVAQTVIAGNSGGSWNSSTGTLDELVTAMGVAKVAVMNDYYTPSAFVMSATNADRLSNWTGFTRDGFPNATLNAAGFAGSVKGLPIFASTQMPDSHILVVHRELVQHRVLSGKPMHLVGPFPTYSNGRLVAAQQWYVEEYNRTLSLIADKGGYVRVV